MDKIAANSQSIWLGGWNANVQSDVANDISAATSQGATQVFTAYNIPFRDCGGYSAGGATDATAYANWINGIAQGIAGHRSAVILEPDGLSTITCLSSTDQENRLAMLKSAVQTLKGAGAAVYIDAGHSNWVGVNDMANRLQAAGIAGADGFALNTSNYMLTSDEANYGNQISALVGGKHFIVDTSRNGLGSNGEWCNPSGRALGQRPTASTGNSTIDAYLWLKAPGESDGQCNGGPSAGVWWPDYALGLAQRAAY